MVDRNAEDPKAEWQAQSEEEWFLHLPGGAWERQEAKNRDLRQRVLQNLSDSRRERPASSRPANPAEVDPAARRAERLAALHSGEAFGPASKAQVQSPLVQKRRGGAAPRWGDVFASAAGEVDDDEENGTRTPDPESPVAEIRQQRAARWEEMIGAGGQESGAIVDGMREWVERSKARNAASRDIRNAGPFPGPTPAPFERSRASLRGRQASSGDTPTDDVWQPAEPLPAVPAPRGTPRRPAFADPPAVLADIEEPSENVLVEPIVSREGPRSAGRDDRSASGARGLFGLLRRGESDAVAPTGPQPMGDWVPASPGKPDEPESPAPDERRAFHGPKPPACLDAFEDDWQPSLTIQSADDPDEGDAATPMSATTSGEAETALPVPAYDDLAPAPAPPPLSAAQAEDPAGMLPADPEAPGGRDDSEPAARASFRSDSASEAPPEPEHPFTGSALRNQGPLAWSPRYAPAGRGGVSDPLGAADATPGDVTPPDLKESWETAAPNWDVLAGRTAQSVTALGSHTDPPSTPADEVARVDDDASQPPEASADSAALPEAEQRTRPRAWEQPEADEDALWTDETGEDDAVIRAFRAHAASDATPQPRFAELLGEGGDELVAEISAQPAPGARRTIRAEDWGDAYLPPIQLPSERSTSIYRVPMSDLGAASAELEPAIDRPIEQRRRSAVRGLVETVLLALLVFLAVRASFQNFRVDGSSMYPSLHDGQFLIVNKLVYSEVNMSKLARVLPFIDADEGEKRFIFHGPKRGDIVVLRDPRRPEQDLVKRVIALPGETVEIKDGKVFINDYLLDEPYIKSQWSDNRPKVTVPDGQFYVLGDNRNNSLDSRSSQVGLIPQSLIIGKADLTYWPMDQFGFAPNGPGATQKPEVTTMHVSELDQQRSAAVASR